jgi:hypothetical protein
MSSSDELKNKKLILLTTAGIISGKHKPDPKMDKKLNLKELDKESASSLTTKFVAIISSDYKKSYSVKSPLPGDDGFILLEDVTIQTGDTVKCLTSLVVFFDQIIGICFEDTSNEV